MDHRPDCSCVLRMTDSHDFGAFLALPSKQSGPESHFVVLPVPYEQTVTYGGGTSQGPAAILNASEQVELWDEWLEGEVESRGVRTLPAITSSLPPEELALILEPLVGELLDEGRFPFLLGGEHSVSLGPIRAAVARHPGLMVLQLDAHPDLRDQYEGTHFGHGCVMRRVHETGVPIHAFGVRAISPEERDFYAQEDSRASCVLAKELLGLPPNERASRILQNLPAGVPLWLSWDVDGLDPSVVPCTGTPEPGGIDWYTVSEVLRLLVERGHPIVGGELLELSPQPDQHASSFAVARLAHRMLVAGAQSPVT